MDLRTTRSLTYDSAAQLVREATASAAEHGTPVAVAVVDAHGDLLAFARMDGAPAFSAGLAIAKAVTSATFGRPTTELEALVIDRPAFAVGFLPQGDWYVGRGGAAIVVDGETVGAVGVSGNTAEAEDSLAKQLAGS